MGSLALPLPSSSRPALASSLSGSRVPEGRADVRNASLDLCQNHHCIASATFYWTKQVRRWPQIQGERKSLQSFSFNPKANHIYLPIFPLYLPISPLFGKDPEAGKDWRQEEKRATEDEMVGWHHRLNGHEFEETLGGGEGQESLVCCSPWGHKELDTT